jgi:hypothetical protein
VPYVGEEGKLTLREIERKHHLSTLAVAAIACVEPSLVYRMEQGGALSHRQVERILGGLSQVTSQYSPWRPSGVLGAARGGFMN